MLLMTVFSCLAWLLANKNFFPNSRQPLDNFTEKPLFLVDLKIMIQSSKRQVKRGANIILKVVKVVKDELTAFAFNCVFY